MVDALHERIQQDARFAADVSHELRTPVTTLTTSLSLLQRAEGLTPDAVNAVQLMTDELARFRRALEDLLTLGRLDAGADLAEFSVTEARELVRQALIASGRSADRLRTDPSLSPATLVEVDRRQMLRALTNLFDNADVHAGGLTGVRITAIPGFVDIHVEDRGPGVPAEDSDRIFERFARADGAKAGTGSGLGLSIVAQTVRNHGGGVWCANRDDRGGAEFVLRLPTIGHREGDA
jgi:signal transduction histidine kinase